jgi:hypothetical protein
VFPNELPALRRDEMIEHLPEREAPHLGRGVAAKPLAGCAPVDDPLFPVQHNEQRVGGAQGRQDRVSTRTILSLAEFETIGHPEKHIDQITES